MRAESPKASSGIIVPFYFYRENRIPFEIAQNPDPFYSEINMTHVRKAVQELRTGKGRT